MDHLVGVGADHRHVAAPHLGEHRRVIGDRFAVVVDEAGAQHGIGLIEAGEGYRQVDGKVVVAVGTEMEDVLAGAHFDQNPGDIAR